MIKRNKSTKKYTKKGKRSTSKIPKPLLLGTDMLAIKCEYYDYIGIASGNADCAFAKAGATYANYGDIIQLSPSWTSYQAGYGEYCIHGVSVEVMNVNPNIGQVLTVGGVNCGQIPIFLMHYPAYTGTGFGADTGYSDQVFKYNPADTNVQSKYWGYKNGFLPGSGNGLGVYNQNSNVSNQLGEIGLGTYRVGLTNVALIDVVLYAMKICLYITFKSKLF